MTHQKLLHWYVVTSHLTLGYNQITADTIIDINVINFNFLVELPKKHFY